MVMIAIALTLMQAGSGIVTVARGANSAIDVQRETIVRTASEWQALWKAHAGSVSPPAVDFAQHMVAAVFLGTRPTGGYGIEIVALRREGSRLIIEHVERRPPADAIVTQALTAPFHIVAIERHLGDVQFRSIPPATSGL